MKKIKHQPTRTIPVAYKATGVERKSSIVMPEQNIRHPAGQSRSIPTSDISEAASLASPHEGLLLPSPNLSQAKPPGDSIDKAASSPTSGEQPVELSERAGDAKRFSEQSASALKTAIEKSTKASTGAGLAHNSGKEKKREPQSIAEFLEHFYTGKGLKTLPDSFVQRIGSGAQDLPPELRSILIQRGLEADPSLEKSRQLIQLARLANPNRSLERILREFARDVTLFHPVLRGSLGQSFVFPQTENGSTLQEVWAALYPESVKSISTREKIVTADSDATVGKEEQSGEKNSRSKELLKARRNAFMCSLLWRLGNDFIGFAEAMRVFRDTTLKVKKKSASLERDLVDLLVSLSNTECENVALFAEWSNQNLHLQTTKVAQFEEQLAERNREVERLMSEVLHRDDDIREKQAESERVTGSLKAAQDELSVLKVHTRADYEELRARALGILKRNVTELENVEVALSRQVPKIDTAKDVVKEVVDSLQSYVKDLEGKR